MQMIRQESGAVQGWSLAGWLMGRNNIITCKLAADAGAAEDAAGGVPMTNDHNDDEAQDVQS